jgi:serine/threonine protein kinase
MAPELWEGKEADKMADLYALGVMAYEMLTGEVPFTGDTPIAVGYKHVHGEVPRTGMGGMVDEVMRVAMAKERERRFQSGTALVMALEKALEGREISSHSSSESITIIDRRKSEEITRDSQRILPTPSNDMKTEKRSVAQKEVNPITAIFACIIVVMMVVLSYWLFYEQSWKYRSLSSQSYQSQKSLSLFSQPSVTMSHKEEKSILSQQMEATEQLISQLNKAVEILDQKPQSSNIRVQKVWVEGEKCEYCFKNHGKVFVLLSNGIVKKLTNDGVDPRISKDGYKVGWLEKAVFAKGGNIENAYCYTIKAILYDLRENKIIKECDIFGEPIPQWVKELWGEDVY